MYAEVLNTKKRVLTSYPRGRGSYSVGRGFKYMNHVHEFKYYKVKFVNGKHHFSKKCIHCFMQRFIKSNKVPKHVSKADLPVVESKKLVKQSKQVENKKEVKTILKRNNIVVPKVVVVKPKVPSIPKIKKIKVHPILTKAIKNYISSEEFYNSRVWLSLRYKALLKYNRKCMCCGASGVEIHIDHIKPRSLYPELELSLDNLQILCRDCNLGKSNTDETDFRDQSL
jgi:hypothetical protein